MTMVEFHLNGKTIRVDDEMDETKTGIVAPIIGKENKEIEELESKEFNDDTKIDIFGDNDEK